MREELFCTDNIGTKRDIDKIEKILRRATKISNSNSNSIVYLRRKFT